VRRHLSGIDEGSGEGDGIEAEGQRRPADRFAAEDGQAAGISLAHLAEVLDRCDGGITSQGAITHGDPHRAGDIEGDLDVGDLAANLRFSHHLGPCHHRDGDRQDRRRNRCGQPQRPAQPRSLAVRSMIEGHGDSRAAAKRFPQQQKHFALAITAVEL